MLRDQGGLGISQKKRTHEGLLRLVNLAFNHLGGIETKL
jgi:hypothetical protein